MLATHHKGFKLKGCRVLVFGASGYIGSHLVPELVQAGFSVIASSRNADVLKAREWEGVEVIAADALKPETLPTVLKGVDVAYYLVHSMASGQQFALKDIEAARNFSIAATQVGVKQIIYLGGLVPGVSDSAHINSRRDTGNVLRSSGDVPVTELRAGIIVGPGSAAFEVMRDLVFHLPVMLTPQWVRSKSPPVALEDLLFYLINMVLIPEGFNKIFDVAGPEYLSYEQMMRTLAEVAGRRPPTVIPVPLLSPKLSAYWLKYVTSVPTGIASALIEGLKHDFIADDRPLKSLFPRKTLDFRTSVERAFAIEEKHAVQSRWVEGAFSIREQRIDYAYYAKKASGESETTATPEALWQVLCSIGGDTRYFRYNLLWATREWLDWLIGGPGRNLGRRHPKDLRLGDKIDSWTVIGLEKNRRLTLRFGMRAPGAGVLEFLISPTEPHKTKLTVTAYWHPAGLAGLLYWYSLEPAHLILFSQLTAAICERTEKLSITNNG